MKYVLVSLLLVSSAAYSQGWSQFAVPTRVDIERGNGLMVYGSFGNVGNCTVADRFYVLASHPQYEEIYSAVLTAFTSQKQVQVHIASCDSVTWYSVAATTYNILGAGGALNMKH